MGSSLTQPLDTTVCGDDLPRLAGWLEAEGLGIGHGPVGRTVQLKEDSHVMSNVDVSIPGGGRDDGEDDWVRIHLGVLKAMAYWWWTSPS